MTYMAFPEEELTLGEHAVPWVTSSSLVEGGGQKKDGGTFHQGEGAFQVACVAWGDPLGDLEKPLSLSFVRDSFSFEHDAYYFSAALTILNTCFARDVTGMRARATCTAS